MTQRPRRRPGRGYGLTLAPLRIHSVQDPSWSINSIHPTNTLLDNIKHWWPVVPTKSPETVTTRRPHIAPLSQAPSPTTAPTETTTSWWPPGVKLGPRPSRPYLPMHIVDPKQVKWDRKFPNIWFRTGGTRFTYAPEILNYPITFDWNVPRDKRVDKYTQRPDWPLNSPLFGSNQVYDYLDDVSLPTPLESGETEFPPTSPEPWWTYPPWWEEKIAGEVNGTTARPVYTTKMVTLPSPTKLPVTTTTKLAVTQPISTIETTTKETKISKIEKLTKVKPTDNSLLQLSTTTVISDSILKQRPEHKVINHEGPWWKLTIIQQLFPTTLAPNSPNIEHNRVKRFVRHNPLVRQNAIRRKHNKTQWKKRYSNKFSLPLYNEAWTKESGLFQISKSLLENILRSAIDELTEEVLCHVKANGPEKDLEYDKGNESIDKYLSIKRHLSTLHSRFLSAFQDFTQEKQKHFAYELIILEIGENIQHNLLAQVTAIKDYFNKNSQISSKLMYNKKKNIKDISDTKMMRLVKLFLKHNLIFSKELNSSLQYFSSIIRKAEVDFFGRTVLSKETVKRKDTESEIHEDNALHSAVLSHKYFTRNKREDNIVDFNKSLNLSSQSMEKIVDEIIEEIPMKTLNNEVKTDLVADLHSHQLKKLGKTNVNKEVISKMAEFEDDNLQIDQITKDPVKQVITQLLNEVLSTLRKHDWMKNVMIKLFEEGYSVDSVVESIANQISIETLLKSMEEEGVNITQNQRELVLSEFTNYKFMLNEMLKNEILLWEHQLRKDQTLIRKKRDSSSRKLKKLFNGYFQRIPKQTDDFKHFPFLTYNVMNLNNRLGINRKRIKRDVEDYNLSPEVKRLESGDYGNSETQLNIDKDLSDMEKNSMPDDKKIKKLKKHLKWLKSQTENPADIVFPDNFEEELMRKESYEEEKVKAPRIAKKRYQWNVRTKKPVLKVYTFLPKIRLTRGKPFVPLTTTEEHLEIPETQPTTRKKRTYKPPPAKTVLDPAAMTTLQTFKKNFWLDFTYKTLAPKIVPRARASQRPQLLRRRTQKPDITFATLKTFPTMKFGKNTQQPIISLQEFLKRRDEFRRVREEVMWNRNFMSSGEQGTDKPFTKGISEHGGKSSEDEEEELEFDAKLSAEVNPAVFTMQPMSDFLFLKPEITTKHDDSKNLLTPTKAPLGTKTVTRRLKGNKIATKSKGTRRFTKRTGYTRTPNKGSLKMASKKYNTSITLKQKSKSKEGEIQEIPDDSKRERKKRDLLTADSFHPVTTMESKKDIFSTDEPSFYDQQNVPCSKLELKIQSQPIKEINSFETYQIEHKKWFGERRRSAPVNNFDIDWEQMRRKLHVEEISSWQKHKTAHLETTEGTLSPPKNNLHWPKVMFSENYKSESNKYRSKPFYRNYISEEKSSDLKTGVPEESLEPPFGKVDKNGKTAFGRLYQEPKKRHYLLHDNRDLFFHKNEINKLINKTYDSEFRIKTHRRTHWYNRTYDPKYVFTQYPTLRNITKLTYDSPETTKSKPNSSEATLRTTTPDSILHNDSQPFDPHFDSYVNILRGHRVISIRPKHKSFRDIKNNTVVVNQENDTFILQRSNKIPWDNNTNLDVYKTYRKSRKRFYNKTIDIVFSYYIFHKFHCENASRDVGYGRMSNVVNRWYNRTFVPKYRPDMYYLHNRYKSGKEFNYYKNEFNILHALMSEGKFDPSRWAQVIPGFNKSEPKISRIDAEFNKINKESAEYEKRVQHVLRSKEESRENILSKTTSRAPEKIFTTLTWKITSRHKINSKLFITVPPTNSPKLSFFQAVKEKSFSFLKNLFRKENINKNEN